MCFESVSSLFCKLGIAALLFVVFYISVFSSYKLAFALLCAIFFVSIIRGHVAFFLILVASFFLLLLINFSPDFAFYYFAVVHTFCFLLFYFRFEFPRSNPARRLEATDRQQQV